MNINLQQIRFAEVQHYSDDLGEVLKKINKKNPNKDDDVVDYVSKITNKFYNGIERKYGGSYYVKHLVAMQKMVASVINGDDNFRKFTEIIALLHDIVEDKLISYDSLEELTSQEVRHIVWTLSESIESRKFKEAHIGKVLTFIENGNSITRKYTKKDMKVDMLRESLVKIKLLNNLPNKYYYQAAALVRVADMLNNLSDFRVQNDDLLDRNIYKAKIIVNELNDTLLTNDLIEVIKELEWLKKEEKIN